MTRTARDLAAIGDITESVREPFPAGVRARARLVTASYAKDADDCRMLFELLGLLDEVEDWPGSRICVHCNGRYTAAGVRRRDRFCSTRCYQQSTGDAAEH